MKLLAFGVQPGGGPFHHGSGGTFSRRPVNRRAMYHWSGLGDQGMGGWCSWTVHWGMRSLTNSTNTIETTLVCRFCGAFRSTLGLVFIIKWSHSRQMKTKQSNSVVVTSWIVQQQIMIRGGRRGLSLVLFLSYSPSIHSQLKLTKPSSLYLFMLWSNPDMNNSTVSSRVNSLNNLLEFSSFRKPWLLFWSATALDMRGYIPDNLVLGDTWFWKIENFRSNTVCHATCLPWN